MSINGLISFCKRSYVTNNKAQKVVIIGGSGLIGKYVAKAFIRDPTTLIQLTARNLKNVEDLRSLGMQILPPISGDITSRSDVLEACKGAGVIINLVGIMHEHPPKYTFENVQHQGACNVAFAAEVYNAHLIHISAIGADPNSEIPYAKTKGLGEIAVRELSPKATIIRPSIVFVFGGGKTKFQPVYVWDLAMAIYNISKNRQKFEEKIFEIGGPTVYTYKEIIKLTLNQAGIKRPVISIPWSISFIQGFFLEKLPPNLFTITRDQIKLLKKDNIVSDDPHILKLSDLGINPTPAEKILYTYLKKHDIVTPNKRTHRPFSQPIDEEIKEVKKIRKEIPEHALKKETEHQKPIDKKK
ncbi:4072_t:CDS:2 [Diversispora eburnea]|uniref:4072_t:CDS:1 n=1 Tax=Diversispora eburnea TaxID=1213867 RepID=A0A9N9AR92_9GLOM|nr:4072_t:CDS:2 [Diversispora eburnea]